MEMFDLGAFEAARGVARAEKAAQLDGICRETGFLVLTGHGVPDAVIAAQWEAVRRFFALPPAEKAQVAVADGAPYGWLGPGTEALARSRGEETPPDLKESFNGGPLTVPEDVGDPAAYDFCYRPTPWPDLPGFRAAWQDYYREMEALAARIMAAFAEALGLERTFFAPFIGQPVSALRALRYPSVTEAAAGQQRAGAHSDYGSLTILLPGPGARGLQIARAGDWVDVVAPAGAFVVNIGDLMARWTADRWVSTLHRVVAAPPQPERFSLAFFHQPDWQAEIVPLDGSDAYPPVRSGPYLMEKFRAAAGG